jgi:hypothetical protein
MENSFFHVLLYVSTNKFHNSRIRKLISFSISPLFTLYVPLKAVDAVLCFILFHSILGNRKNFREKINLNFKKIN